MSGTRPFDAPAPFRIHASEAALGDLRRRLDATRWPEAIVPDWSLGTPRSYLQDLVEYWRDGFDWRAQERWLVQALPSERVRIRGLELHYARVRGRGERLFPLLLMHGWPSSYVEMAELAALLAEPIPAGEGPLGEFDGFELIVPSIPGHGFSEGSNDPRYSSDDAADAIRDLMVDVLGHSRFGAHGGDRGAFVAAGLAHRHPDHVVGIHLNLAMGLPGPLEERTPEETRWIEEIEQWRAIEAGYSAIQSTKPLSLAYGLMDSPVGLAGWIVEKFQVWSDCAPDAEPPFDRDRLLTNVMIYWLSGSILPSMQYYWAHRVTPPVAVTPDRIEVPTGFALFPKEVMRPPRSVIERKYALARWSEMKRGGHFPALEEPEALAREIRAFYAELSG
jgi:microsomal epoxide hydrolase